ncbi:MAG: glycosyltransferase family 2 protein [Alphaproteobacteria bacterium]|jgi:glycosyltransferase involved in cell wall biosynthesis|nr:glycosyltransferase family 2 protein [Alphaproteobacteria bacterium]
MANGSQSQAVAVPVAASLSIIVPAHNEEQGIGAVVDGLARPPTAAALGEAQVIVVDDGSTDGTRSALAQANANGVTVLCHDVRRGYGAALKTGILATEADLVCITDADGTYPNERIADLCRRLRDENLDMVVGARTGATVKIPLVRKPAKWFLNRMVNFIARQRVPDVNSGLRVFRRDVVLRFLPILPDGFSFTTTITLAMLVNGYRVAYEPIDYHARVGRSKISPIRDTLRFLRLVVMMGLYFAPLRVFMPFAGLLFLAALLWGAFSLVFLGQLADVSTLVIVMTSIQVASVGLLAELINRRVENHLER